MENAAKGEGGKANIDAYDYRARFGLEAEGLVAHAENIRGSGCVQENLAMAGKEFIIRYTKGVSVIMNSCWQTIRASVDGGDFVVRWFDRLGKSKLADWECVRRVDPLTRCWKLLSGAS